MTEYIVTVPNTSFRTFLNTTLGKTLLDSGRVVLITNISNPLDYYYNETIGNYLPTPSSLRYLVVPTESENAAVKNSINVLDVYTLEEWEKQTKYK